jgi:hypothetical protein
MKRGGDKLALWVQDWAYQRGNQNSYIEEQTTQWPEEKVQKDKHQEPSVNAGEPEGLAVTALLVAPVMLP